MYSDLEHVAGVLAGDQPAWLEWNGRFRSVLTGIARREFRIAPEDTEDLLQDLVVALLERDGRQLRAYRQEASLLSWLCTIWRHRCLDFKRRRSLHARSWLDVTGGIGSCRLTPGRSVGHPVEMRLLAGQALGLAGARDRMLLQLHFIQGWSQRDIASHVRAPENTIASSLARAKVRIRRIVDMPVRRGLAEAVEREPA